MGGGQHSERTLEHRPPATLGERNEREFRVNANTIVRTYEHLGFDGTVRSMKGVGFFVAEGACESIKERRRQAFFDELLPLCVKQMELLGISPDEIIPIIKRHENKQ